MTDNSLRKILWADFLFLIFITSGEAAAGEAAAGDDAAYGAVAGGSAFAAARAAVVAATAVVVGAAGEFTYSCMSIAALGLISAA